MSLLISILYNPFFILQEIVFSGVIMRRKTDICNKAADAHNTLIIMKNRFAQLRVDKLLVLMLC